MKKEVELGREKRVLRCLRIKVSAERDVYIYSTLGASQPST
jgi:hypothetical protein